MCLPWVSTASHPGILRTGKRRGTRWFPILENGWATSRFCWICQFVKSFVLQVHQLFHRLHLLWIPQLCHRRQPFFPHGPFPQSTLSCLWLWYHRILLPELPKTKGTDLCPFQTIMKCVFVGILEHWSSMSCLPQDCLLQLLQVPKEKWPKLYKSPGLARVVSRKRSTPSAFLDSMS